MSGYVPKGWTAATGATGQPSAVYKPKGWIQATDAPSPAPAPQAAPSTEEEPGFWDTLGDWYAQGGAKGGADELAGPYFDVRDRLRELAAGVPLGSSVDSQDSIKRGTSITREMLAKEAKANPKTAGVGRFLGDMTTDLGASAVGLPIFTPAGQAASGALSGALYSDSDDPTDRITGAGIGAMTGYGLGKLSKALGPFKAALLGAGLQEGLGAVSDETPEQATMRRVGELGGLAVSGAGALRGKAAQLLGFGEKAGKAEGQLTDRLNKGTENYQAAQAREYGKNESTALEAQATKGKEFDAAVKDQGERNLKGERLADKFINEARLMDMARAASAKQAAGEDLSDMEKTALALLGNDAKRAHAALRALPQYGEEGAINDPLAQQGKRTLMPDFLEESLNALRQFRDRASPGDGKAARLEEIRQGLLAQQAAQGESGGSAEDDVMRSYPTAQLPGGEEVQKGRVEALAERMSPDAMAAKLGAGPEAAVPSGQRQDIANRLGYFADAPVLPTAPPQVDPNRPRFMMGAQTPPTMPLSERMPTELDAGGDRLAAAAKKGAINSFLSPGGLTRTIPAMAAGAYLGHGAGAAVAAPLSVGLGALEGARIQAGTKPNGEFRDPAAAVVWNRALDRVVGGDAEARGRIGQFLAGQNGDTLRARLTYLIGTIPGLKQAVDEDSTPATP